MNFLYKGEIQCAEEFDSLKIQENLHKIFGFPKFLGLRCQNVHDAVQEVDSGTIDRETPTPAIETQTPVSKSELTLSCQEQLPLLLLPGCQLSSSLISENFDPTLKKGAS